MKDTIEISWHIDDVLMQDPSLTSDEARQVLDYMYHKHDANVGINWEVIDTTIEHLRELGDIS